jgi:hypothetical protein
LLPVVTIITLLPCTRKRIWKILLCMSGITNNNRPWNRDMLVSQLPLHCEQWPVIINCTILTAHTLCNADCITVQWLLLNSFIARYSKKVDAYCSVCVCVCTHICTCTWFCSVSTCTRCYFTIRILKNIEAENVHVACHQWYY